MAKTRTFVAIDADDAVRRRLAALTDRLRPYAPDANWVEEENLHLTLLFLGDLADAEVAEVCRRTEWIARANPPFTLRVAGVGAFPNPVRPRALWVGATDGAEEICRLQADLDEDLTELAPRGENRSFVPHWTLARMGRRGAAVSPHLTDVLAGLADHEAGELRIDQIVVYSSELRPGGPDYYPLATCPLGIQGKA
ncbi:2',5' RNA ligase family [Botrimarina colliarenosi]|uniref:RNA 2',3'-cyclic phosphodiesterase n=1 Tax=Botrimarina colliarenosi TaxID=2528001 RepID=A0A5C6A3K5_9BACT|nr:RNA 2',3'-cyclic phosphodiesterase [Botrimarina colliarenosi]TWT94059.1 2',5' RNA ligase family [Botrimarina colliarenosi]